MNIREILALDLRELRQVRGISQQELAHRAEIDRTCISSLERSVYAASIDVLDRIARVLNVEAATFSCDRRQRRRKRTVVQWTIECKTKKQLANRFRENRAESPASASSALGRA